MLDAPTQPSPTRRPLFGVRQQDAGDVAKGGGGYEFSVGGGVVPLGGARRDDGGVMEGHGYRVGAV